MNSTQLLERYRANKADAAAAENPNAKKMWTENAHAFRTMAGKTANEEIHLSEQEIKGIAESIGDDGVVRPEHLFKLEKQLAIYRAAEAVLQELR